MNHQKKPTVSYQFFNHFLLLIFCLVPFYFVIGCSWEAKKTLTPSSSTPPSSQPPITSSTTTSSSTTTITSSTTTSSSTTTMTSSTTTSSSTTSSASSNFISFSSSSVGSVGCSANQTLPDYKEVEGQCFPSCEKRLETHLENSGVILGRGHYCNNSEFYIVNTNIPTSQIYDTESGACCSLHLNNSLNANINHSCRIKETEKHVQCWGSNQYGQLGNNCKASDQQAQNVNYVVKEDNTHECYTNEVSQNDRLSGIILLALGKKHSCGLLENRKKVVCWGNNQKGQLGVSSNINESLKPVAVEIPENMQNLTIQSITANDDYSCLRVEDNAQKNRHCWGDYPEDL